MTKFKWNFHKEIQVTPHIITEASLEGLKMSSIHLKLRYDPEYSA